MKWKTEYIVVWALIFLRLASSWWIYTNVTSSVFFETIAVVTGVLDLIALIFALVYCLCLVTETECLPVRSIALFSWMPSLIFAIGYVIVFHKKIDQGKDPVAMIFKVANRSKKLGNRFTREQVRIILWVEEWAGSDYLDDFGRAIKDDYFIASGGLIFLKILGDIKALHLKTESKYDEKVFAAIKKTKTLMGAIRDKIYALRQEESRAEKNAYYEFHARRTKIISELVEEGIKDVEFLYGVTKN